VVLESPPKELEANPMLLLLMVTYPDRLRRLGMNMQKEANGLVADWRL